MISNKTILSDVMKDSQLSDISNIFYVDSNKGKYQKQYMVNKGDVIDTSTDLIDYELDEHKVIINYSTEDDNIIISDELFTDKTVALNQVMINSLHSTIHNHVLNYLMLNAHTTDNIKYYRPSNRILRFFDNISNVFNPRKENTDVINLIQSKCKSDSIVVLSVAAYRDIIQPNSDVVGKVKILDALSKSGFNSNFIPAGYLGGNIKCYVTPSSTEKSILIVNKNDLDVIINRDIRIVDNKGLNRKSIDIPIGLKVYETKPCINKINLI
jgi:hypothetical protein